MVTDGVRVNKRRPDLRLLRRLDGDLAGRRDEFVRFFMPNSFGWIRTVRTATGMTLVELAQKLRVSQPAMTKLEQAEDSGRITIQKLEAVAAALDCTLVYGLVPNTSFEDIAKARGAEVDAPGPVSLRGKGSRGGHP